MSRLNDMLRELLEDVQRFLLITLNDEILSAVALNRKESLLMKISHIRQEYPQLQIKGIKDEEIQKNTSPKREKRDVSKDSVSPGSPPPYFDMNGGLIKPQTNLEISKNENILPSQEDYEVYEREGSVLSDNKSLSDLDEHDSHSDNAHVSKKDLPYVSAIELSKADKNGYLEKKSRERLGGLLSPLQRRWCAVKYGTFYYFDGASEKRPRGHVDLTGYEARPTTFACKDSAKKKFCFEMVCPGKRTYQFIALTEQDMRQWIEAIERCSPKMIVDVKSILREGKPLPIPDSIVEDENNYELEEEPIYEDEEVENNYQDEEEAIYEALDEEFFNSVRQNTFKDKEEIEDLYHDCDNPLPVDDAKENFVPEDWFVALWDCFSSDETELEFMRGDLMKVVNKDLDQFSWWFCQLKNRTGLVPKTFLMEAYERI